MLLGVLVQLNKFISWIVTWHTAQPKEWNAVNNCTGVRWFCVYSCNVVLQRRTDLFYNHPAVGMKILFYFRSSSAPHPTSLKLPHFASLNSVKPRGKERRYTEPPLDSEGGFTDGGFVWLYSSWRESLGSKTTLNINECRSFSKGAERSWLSAAEDRSNLRRELQTQATAALFASPERKANMGVG